MGHELLLRKIRKTIALAQNNTNQAESENAWNKVLEMLKRHNLTIEEVFDSPRIQKNPSLLLKSPTQINPKKRKSISWKEFFQIETDPMVTLQIIPDQTVHSGKAVESILNTFHSMREVWLDRIWNEGYRLHYKTQDYASFRVVYQSNRICFYILVPSEYKKTVIHSIENVWSKVAIKEVDSTYLSTLDSSKTSAAYIELKDHYFKSTLVDRTRVDPIPSLMSAGRNLLDDDLAILDMAFVPISNNWQIRARTARNKYRDGKNVNKVPTRLSDILYLIGDFIVDGIIEKFMSLVDAMVDVQQETKKTDYTIANQQLLPSTEQKYTYPGFDLVIRILSQSEQRNRAEKTLTAIGTAFKDVSADNEFEIKRVPYDGAISKHTSTFVKQLQNNKLPLLRINGNIVSIPEASQLLQLPSAPIQEEYPEIESIKQKEVEADQRLLEGGLKFGEVTYKRENVIVHQPVKDWNELCLPDVSIGGMGQGKTRGHLANRAVEAYLNGFGAVVIDPAKREIGDEIQAVVDAGVIPKEDFIRIDFGEYRMRMDWVEATRHIRGRSRLATTILEFFEIQEDTSGQTSRFLRASILALKTGQLTELFDIFEDEERLEEAIADLKEGSMAKKTLQQYKSFSPDRRRQIIVPIYNRLDEILGDEILAECMESDQGLDFIDIMSQKKIVVLDLPDDDVFGITKDILINLIDSKIDIATRLRKKIYGEKAEFPFFYIMDEPHKYLRAAKRWSKSVVEMRKWRIALVWAFHYWEQIPQQLQKAIKAALPHYHLYPSSKATFKSLEEEIVPFTIEDALKLQRFHAINCIRVGGENAKPFIAKMTSPPSMRFKKETT